jgi:hypothetical protein
MLWSRVWWDCGNMKLELEIRHDPSKEQAKT